MKVPSVRVGHRPTFICHTCGKLFPCTKIPKPGPGTRGEGDWYTINGIHFAMAPAVGGALPVSAYTARVAEVNNLETSV